MNYYNEHDPKAAAWLMELIAQGYIPDGDVDTRSITEVTPDEISHYTQCHFFAGIGGWSLALELAGWPADAPVWTGSCPCQPFSSAGKQLAQKDERHLWPVFFNLIRERRPVRVFGEQVASAIGKGWLDGISADLESENYACGAAVLGAHSVGAPHLRQRLFWVADASGGQRQQRIRPQGDDLLGPAHCGAVGRLVNPKHHGGRADQPEREAERRASDGRPCGMVQSSESGLEGHAWNGDHRNQPGRIDKESYRHVASAGCSVPAAMGNTQSGGRGIMRHETQPGSGRHSLGTSWSRFEIVHCRDGKARRFEPGSFPLADGIPGRVGLLRGYGNAIVPQAAAEFIQAFLEVTTTANNPKTA
jgi:DNA (cytosine-5)-methyltransferase 1